MEYIRDFNNELSLLRQGIYSLERTKSYLQGKPECVPGFVGYIESLELLNNLDNVDNSEIKDSIFEFVFSCFASVNDRDFAVETFYKSEIAQSIRNGPVGFRFFNVTRRTLDMFEEIRVSNDLRAARHQNNILSFLMTVNGVECFTVIIQQLALNPHWNYVGPFMDVRKSYR